MKKYALLLLLSAIFIFAFSTQAFAVTSKISFTQNAVENGTINISNYTLDKRATVTYGKNSNGSLIKDSSGDVILNPDINTDEGQYEVSFLCYSNLKQIDFEYGLLEYLIKANKTIKISFQNGMVISFSPQALTTKEYKAAKAEGIRPTMRLLFNILNAADRQSFTSEQKQVLQDNGIYPYPGVDTYFKSSQMNPTGLYAESSTAFEVKLSTVIYGKEKTTCASFAAPVTVTAPYDAAAIDKQLLSALKINGSTFSFYTYENSWKKVASTVNTSNETVAVSSESVGIYMAIYQSSSQSSTPTTTTPTSKTGFVDLAGNWSESDITYLQNKNVIRNEGSYFYPNRAITRAEYAVYLTRVLSLAEKSTAAGQFSDLNPAKYYYQDVITAASYGLVRGVGDGKFAPDASITRQEMAAMITNALEYRGHSTTIDGTEINTYGDNAKIGSWAKASCGIVTKLGLMNGKVGGLFAPAATTSRAEAAVILARLHRYLYN